MSLEDFRAEYRAMRPEEKLAVNAKYRAWRRADLHRMRHSPLGFYSVLHHSPGPPEHYDAVLSAFLADLATQRLLGESS
jgi:hypothetical protein